eukprot:NODE_5195_length_725_cov_4.474852_g4371_i0.p1 GENE.NODE_5195_length_725_cov_4.474852_g4371_i0~~NODE_5195_length_725_cov_4.474852_g4371_i0.p1  ORF type:complete len:60 (-),score=4.06 NODE_5195_length_725_cov_4.474852_g4371_i0:361-540(-)
MAITSTILPKMVEVMAIFAPPQTRNEGRDRRLDLRSGSGVEGPQGPAQQAPAGQVQQAC